MEDRYICINGNCVQDITGIYTLDECLLACEPDLPQRYSCDNGNCISNPYGEFETLTECQSACLFYSCVNDNCISDVNGPFQGLSTCVENCVRSERYSCISGDCVLTPGGAYSDLAACLAQCSREQRYDCVNGNCLPGPAGAFTSLSQCQSLCGTTRYYCGDGCKETVILFNEDLGGTYAALSDCQAACSYDCVNGFCVQTPGGPYQSLSACNAACNKGDIYYQCVRLNDSQVCIPSFNNEVTPYLNDPTCGGNCGYTAPVLYRCLPTGCEADGTCLPGMPGCYQSKAACETACNVTVESSYDCVPDITSAYGLRCIALPNTSGRYSTFAECERNCGRSWRCNEGQSGLRQCNEVNGLLGFASEKECKEKCGYSYNCQDGKCVRIENLTGAYLTESQCLSACKAPRYNCINGDCVEALDGDYADIELCRQACSNAPENKEYLLIDLCKITACYARMIEETVCQNACKQQLTAENKYQWYRLNQFNALFQLFWSGVYSIEHVLKYEDVITATTELKDLHTILSYLEKLCTGCAESFPPSDCNCIAKS
jgi:hypothetical protein